MTATGTLLLAMLAQAGIAVFLYLQLSLQRVPLYSSGQVRARDIALSNNGWPEATRKTSNALDNQFQLPVLFYLCCVIALYLGVGWLEVALAWLFFISRCVHATIHVTTNHLPMRFFAFLAGFILVVLFWAYEIIRVALAAGI